MALVGHGPGPWPRFMAHQGQGPGAWTRSMAGQGYEPWAMILRTMVFGQGPGLGQRSWPLGLTFCNVDQAFTCRFAEAKWRVNAWLPLQNVGPKGPGQG